MNHSIYSADRTTHLKIIIVALVAAIAIAGLGLLSHVSSNAASSQTAGIIKAGKPITMTNSDVLVTR